MKLNDSQSALLILNMQNDYIHPEGALARNGVTLDDGLVLRERLIKLVNSTRDAGITTIAVNFTLISDSQNRPLIGEEVLERYPFLTRGDFQWGKWGHQLMEEFTPYDYMIPKIASSGFFMTHLEWLLKKLNKTHLYFCGISTSREIMATVKDAHQGGFKCHVIADCCRDLDMELHEKAIAELATLVEIKDFKELTF